jgi:DNA-binding transcriptional LysR family regulator
MQIHQLEYLVKVAECGSFSQAAGRLYLSQPSLTKAIRNLEDEYGIKIFERTSKGIQITEKGKDFIYYAKHILASIKNMNMVFSEERISSCSILSVASQQLSFLYELVGSIYEKHKNESFHFNIMELNRSDVIQAVLKGDVNIGLIVRSRSDSKHFNGLIEEKNLEWHKVDTSEVYVSMGPLSPFYNMSSVRFDDIENSFHIALDMERDAIRDLHINYTTHLDENKIAFFNTIQACIAFLLKTPAMLYTPKWVPGFFENTEVHTAKVIDSGTVNELVWLKRKNERLSNIEKQFIDDLYGMFGTTEENSL